MKRNYIKSILTLFTLAIILCGAAGAANAQAQYRKALDFDGDGKVDVTVTRGQGSSGNSLPWYTRSSQTGALKTTQWGGGNNNIDFKCAGDFDGDGKADYCITRRNESGMVWYIMQSGGTFRTVSFGLQTDRPIPADYDGDGKADIAVWRGGSGPTGVQWYILQSSNNQLVVRSSGQDTASNGAQCFPIPAVDIDGDGKQDIAQICQATGNVMLWSIRRSSNGATERYYYGINDADNADYPVPADYDGDGKTDVAVVRVTDTSGGNSSYTWYIRRSSDGGTTAQQFGGSNANANYYDVVVPADYDGDGKADIAIYRNRSGITPGIPQYLYALQSGSGNSLLVVQWGMLGDRVLMIPTDYLSF